ncbi:thioredoxin family protein [Polluticoccus soli]|uniref:thioredoxin family protein n=1 Tax=Polluticoccus soli TaxID=3034150 RepID=UPI0023E2B73A|nr:thioredoxin family protein [Flavipsychrobacter sp. JY13-12]
MKKIFVIAALMMMNLTITAQDKYETTVDEKNGSVVFRGNIGFDDLEHEKTFDWLQQGAQAYKTDAASIAFLKENISQYRLITFMGTWCDDSHILIPQLYKVLSEANFPMGELTMYGVDRTKTTADGAHLTYGVSFVPTVIVLHNGKEVGRITESSRKSVEADLANIIRSEK